MKTVFFLDPDGNLAETAIIGDVPKEHGWGRYPDITGSWQIVTPSKGEANIL